MAPKSSKRTAEAADQALTVLSKLAVVSYENLVSELRAANAALEAQSWRFETALDNISQGICFFDVDERLILCNGRYAEIYRLPPEKLHAGVMLSEIVKLKLAAETLSRTGEAYLAFARSINAGSGSTTWTAELKDGRTIQVCHQPMPDGGWVATHEDITELATSRLVANERVSLQALIDWVPDYLWVKDTESRFVVVNRALAADSGRRTGEMIGLTDFDLHAPELARQFRACEQDLLRRGQPMVDEEEFIVDASGTGKWLSSTKVPLRNALNEIFGLVGIARDITQRKQADDLRNGQAQILEMIAASAPLEDVLDRLVRLIESQLNGIFGSVLLLDKDGSHLRHGAAPSLAKDYTSAIDGVQIGPKAGSCGTAAFRREPVIVADLMIDPLWDDYRGIAEPYGYRSCWSTPILSHTGAVLGVFAMYSTTVREPVEAEISLIDFTTRIAGIAIERKLAEDRIHFMANHDTLTGLPNRALLADRLSQAILYAQRYHRWVSVVFIDVDNFKLVNDTLGHNAGDVLLKTVAGRMVECVRATDTVVRLGGDEFVVVLFDQDPDADLVAATVQKIRAAIAEPVQLGEHHLRTTASMGVANYPTDGANADALLANADVAMYRAKELGRDNFQFYAPEFNATSHEKFLLQEELRNALLRAEFTLLYQPQVDLRSGRVFAVEALIRWQHPTLGLISPMKFIPMAEETGLIVPIGDWVLHEACRQNKAWQDAGLQPMVICVNVSARQFKESNLINRVVAALEDSGLEPKYLELEVTESLIMQNTEMAVATMNALQSLGVQISIDDFGTGYSSLSALKTFPVARLKIDKSFINDLASDANDQAVTSAVISLGQKLNLRVIAEGVETDEQIAFLRNNNCDEMQGYHFSKPVSAAEIVHLLNENHASHEL
ncbi:EAL domain-containing protein [Mesorhizobium sp. B2-4-19]|uniref:EAL domain-containing protein n=1 Tax=Mesorhizobium sp. B2-4-19 TaxID=2589930 RepID=UPI00112C20B9|nr:EAL domain-containing protein [Mesorhizobium sp. B2-4-19]TPK57706.1 EAL domain-containing protein [Mesorhizobium sp. B2-4-19]